MIKCTVLIPFVEEIEFLKGGIREIKKQRNNIIDYEIIIANQSNKKHTEEINDLYSHDEEIKIINLFKIDAGYPIDVGLQHATGEYFCSFDADAFPIHPNWLHIPIQLIEKYGFTFVGKHTGLHNAYKDQGNFFHINNYFRVSKTNIAKKISLDVGFVRYNNRHSANFTPRVQTSWNIDCDNGVVAQWYTDKQKMGPKFSFAINKMLGMTNEMGIYGMVIDDLVFHMVFGFGKEWIEDLDKTLGDPYQEWNKLILTRGLTEEVVKKIKSKLIVHYPIENHREYWDGEKSTSLTHGNEIYDFIESLKNI